MKPIAVLGLAVLATWLVVDEAVASIDCVLGLPVGLSKDDIQTSSPPIGFRIGDSLFGVNYVPGQPLHVQLTYSGGLVSQFFVKAVTLGSALNPVGSFIVFGGEADEWTCLAHADSLVSSASLSPSGVVTAYWIPPDDFELTIAFEVTVVGSDGRVWQWESLLCEAAANSQNSVEK